MPRSSRRSRVRAPRKGDTTRNPSAATVLSASAAAGTRLGSSWRFDAIATAALAPAGVLMTNRASEASLVFTATLVLQCAGRQLWISSIAVRKRTLFAGARLRMRIMLRLLDNRVGAGNTAVKKSTGEIF